MECGNKDNHIIDLDITDTKKDKVTPTPCPSLPVISPLLRTAPPSFSAQSPPSKAVNKGMLLLSLTLTCSLVAMVGMFYHTERTLYLLQREIDDLWVRQKESVEERHTPALATLQDIFERSEKHQPASVVRRSAVPNTKQKRNVCKDIPQGYASLVLNKGYFTRCLEKTGSISECQSLGYQETQNSLNITHRNKALPWAFQQHCPERIEFKLEDHHRKICPQLEGTYLILSQITVIHTTMVSVELQVNGISVRHCKGYGGNVLPRTVCQMTHIAKVWPKTCISLHTLDVPLGLPYEPNDTLLQIIRLKETKA